MTPNSPSDNAEKPHTIIFSIGGYRLRILGRGPLLSAFKPFVAMDGDADFVLRMEAPVEEREWETLFEFDFEDADIHCIFARHADTYSLRLGSHVLLTHRWGSNEVLCSTTLLDGTRFAYAVWFAFVMLTLQRGTTLVHSSVVVKDGAAVLLLGESGTGKSTHTRLWCEHIEGATLLNDDCPVVGHGMVFGSPWSGKTPCFRPEAYPIKAIVRLSQAPHNAIRRLSTLEAFAALQPSLAPMLAYDSHLSDCTVAILSWLLHSIPVYHLACLPDREAALLCYNTIYQ